MGCDFRGTREQVKVTRDIFFFKMQEGAEQQVLKGVKKTILVLSGDPHALPERSDPD